MKAGIPTVFETAILEKAAQNLSTRQIAEWLQAEHGVAVSYATVARFLAKRREERADVAKAIAREKLTKTLGSDIDRLEEIRRDLARRASGAETTSAFCKLTELEIKVLDRKLHYSGAGGADNADGNAGRIRIYLPPECDE